MDNISYTTQSSTTSRQMANFGAGGGGMMNPRSFDPIVYVTELTSKPSVTLESLIVARKNVQNYADETNTMLKKNVYKNYQLFIDTSKEISYLKKEMSQLAKQLNDENKVLDSMLTISIGGSKTGLTPSEKKEAVEKAKEERERKMLQMSKTNVNGPMPTKEFRSIMDSIEGGAGILENKLDSLVYFDGEVIELDDQQDYRELHSMYLVLLNDSLILNTILPDRQVPRITFSVAGGGPSIPQSGGGGGSTGRKYKFQSIIDLETIAAVNVKDRRYPKFEMALKVLMSATTKVFLTNSSAKKKAWMEAFEIAKKYRRTSSRLQRRDTIYSPTTSSHLSAVSSSGGNSDPGYSSTPISETPSAYANNPFEEPEMKEDADENDSDNLPLWLVELPDDLDVYIAQRNFEEAVRLASRANEIFKWNENQAALVDLKLKIENKISELVDALTSELNVAPDRSLQTGPRASRRAVSLLLRLGKSSLAIRLFLDQRTKLLKHTFKQHKSSDGATLNFMKRMTNLYFSHIVETSKEFLRAFEIDVAAMRHFELDNSLDNAATGTANGGNNKWNRRNSDDGNIDNETNSGHSPSTPTMTFSHAALACLNTWNYRQFKEEYLELFKRHVFISAVSREVAVECISVAHHHCIKLRDAIGVDFSFVLSRELQKPIDSLIRVIRTHLSDAISQRADSSMAKDSLQEQVFDSRQKLTKYTQEMSDLELDMDESMIRESSDPRSDPPKQIFIVQITANTSAFARSYLNTLRDLVRLCAHPTTVKAINEVMVQGFKSQMAHMAGCLKKITQGANPELVRANIAFILNRLVPVVIRKYCKALGLLTFPDLQQLSLDYAYLKESSGQAGRITTSFSTSSASSTPKSGSPFGSPIPAPRARKSTTIQVNQSNNNSSNGTAGGGTNNTNWTSGTYL